MVAYAESDRPQREVIGPDNLPVERITRYLREDIVSYPGETAFQPDNIRCAAVLIPFVEQSGEWRLLFTRRTETLPDHKGQVSFPGGGCEVTDETVADTAKREAFEEIGVLPEHIQVLGYLDKMLSVSSFLVSPVVATMPWPYPLNPSTEEVSRVFTVPLSWLADPANREERPFFHPALGTAHMVIYFAPYDGEVVWGLTARLTLTLLQTLHLVER